MRSIEEDILTAFKRASRSIIPEAYNETQRTTFDGNNIISFDITHEFDCSTAKFGYTTSKKLELKMYKSASKNISVGDKLRVKVGINVNSPVQGVFYRYITLGYFFVDAIEEIGDSGTVKVTGYDALAYMTKSFKYDSKSQQGWSAIYGTQIINEICQKYGLTLYGYAGSGGRNQIPINGITNVFNISDLSTGEFRRALRNYKGSDRDALGHLAGAGFGANVVVDDEGRVKVIRPSSRETLYIEPSQIVINSTNYGSRGTYGYQYVITGTSENTVASHTESERDGAGYNFENPFAVSSKSDKTLVPLGMLNRSREDIIVNSVDDSKVMYTQFKTIDLFFDPRLELGDYIFLGQDEDAVTEPLYITKCNVSYNGGLKQTIGCEFPITEESKTQTELSQNGLSNISKVTVGGFVNGNEYLLSNISLTENSETVDYEFKVKSFKDSDLSILHTRKYFDISSSQSTTSYEELFDIDAKGTITINKNRIYDCGLTDYTTDTGGLNIETNGSSTSDNAIRLITRDIYLNGTGDVYLNSDLVLNWLKSTYAPSYGDTLVYTPAGMRTTSSTRKYKKNIKDVDVKEIDYNNLYDLPIRQFEFIDGFEGASGIEGVQIGFIAEEMEEIFPNACLKDEDGKPRNWTGRTMIPAMLKLIQDQKKEIDKLTERLDKLENK